MSSHHDHDAPGHDELEEAADPSPVPTGMIGLLGAVLLAVSLLALTAVYYNAKSSEVAEVVLRAPNEEVVELRAQQSLLLEGPSRWVDRDEQGKTVPALVIPIDRAMQLVVQEGGR